jgi:glycosyltransferase involved in cell wall biosynthesis
MREKKIIVGIDISDLKYATTGQKTFLEELKAQFDALHDPRFSFVYFTTPFNNFKGRSTVTLIAQHIQVQIWKQILLPLKAFFSKTDIVFCSDYYVPYFHLGFKSVQVFHDAFFFENPEQYNQYWRYIHQYLAMPAARKSSFIITPTNYANQTVHQHTGIPLNKLVRIYEAPKTWGPTVTNAAASEKIQSFLNTRYIFNVGIMEKRKNLSVLIKAFKILVDQGLTDTKLVLAGTGTGRKLSDDSENIVDLIKKLKLENQVILTGYLSETDLQLVYQNAAIYVFPSVNEGFGIPVLEAFKAKIPVLVANNSCLPEVGGAGVISFDPDDAASLAALIDQLLHNEKARAQLIQNGQERLTHFSWKNTAQELLAVFEKTVQSKTSEA